MKKSSVTYVIMLFTFVVTFASFATAQKRSSDIILAPEAEALMQCANGGRGTPELPCAGSNWQFGNLGRNNSQWVEGEYVPYRALITALVVGSTNNTITITYGTTKSGKHAIDYLGTWDQSTLPPDGPGGADACVNVSPCSLPSTFQIPLDPTLTAANPGIQPVGENFTIWNGTITAVSGYTTSGTYAGDSSTSITLTYTANAEEVVIAFGGHISTRLDWGIAGSAISISGSPYHTSIGGGDRSMSVDAAIFPAFLIAVKEVSTFGAPPGTTATFEFDFTFTQGLTVTPFTLIDDVVGSGGGGPPLSTNATEVFQIESFDAANTITVVEAVHPAWTLAGITCVEEPGGLPQIDNSVGVPATRTATVIAEEAEIIVCTFANTQFAPTAAPASISGRVVDSFGGGIYNTRVSVMNAQSGEMFFANTNPFGYYTIEGPEVGNFYVMTVSHKRYTFADDTRTFTLNDDITGMDFVANP